MPTPPDSPTATGIQRLVGRAAVDEAFRRELLAAPERVAAADPSLTPRERAVLRAVPPAQLAAMIDAVRPAPGVERRAFLRASSSVLLLGGAALTACPTLTCGGIGPDIPPADAAVPDDAAPLVIVTATLPDGEVGAFYYQELAVTGGGEFKGFALQSGVLPDGLQLYDVSGVISGYPTAAGTFAFEVKVSASDLQVATRSLSITIALRLDAGADDGGPTDASDGGDGP